MSRGTLFFLLLILLSDRFMLTAQSIDEERLTQMVDTALDELDPGEARAGPTAEQLSDLLAAPLNINSASAEQLSEVPGISISLADRIVSYRNNVGRLVTIADLRAVRGITSELMERMVPYVRIAAPGNRRPGVEVTQSYVQRLDKGDGYRGSVDERVYAGSPLRLATRIIARVSTHWTAAWMGEKDPGEPLHPNLGAGYSGFDHTSWGLFREGTGTLRFLAIGDVKVRIGHGLLLWSDGGMQLLDDPVSDMLPLGNGIRPGVSATETSGLRGIAVALAPAAAVRISAFVAQKRVDARLSEVGDSGVADLVLVESGLHRTSLEIARKNAALERTAGLHVSRSGERGIVGLAGYARTLTPRTSVPGSLTGAIVRDVLPRGGITGYARWRTGIALVQSEVAVSSGGSLAAVASVKLPLSRALNLAVQIRRFGVAGYSRYGGAFSRSGNPAFERGVYSGLSFRQGPRLYVRGYTDMYWSPHPVFRASRPSRGFRFRVKAGVRIAPQTTMETEYQKRTEEVSIDVYDQFGRIQDGVAHVGNSNVRLTLRAPVGQKLKLQTRIQTVRAKPAGSPISLGYLVFSELRWSPIRFLSLTGRILHFDSADSSVRLYAAESDLLYSFALTSLSGSGSRYYLRIALLLDRIEIRAKWSVTRRFDTDLIGTGHDRVAGNRIREMRLQVRLRLSGAR